MRRLAFEFGCAQITQPPAADAGPCRVFVRGRHKIATRLVDVRRCGAVRGASRIGDAGQRASTAATVRARVATSVRFERWFVAGTRSCVERFTYEQPTQRPAGDGRPVRHGSSMCVMRNRNARRCSDRQQLGRFALEFTYEQVTQQPDAVVTTLRSALGRSAAN